MANTKPKDKKKKKSQREINRESLEAGISIIRAHPLFGHCMPNIRIMDKASLGSQTMGIVRSDGMVLLNESVTLPAKQWAYVIAHNTLHLAFGHFDADKMPAVMIADPEQPDNTYAQKVTCDISLWNMACDIYVTKFLSDIKFGQPLYKSVGSSSKSAGAKADFAWETVAGAAWDEVKLYEHLMDRGITSAHNSYGTAAVGAPDMQGLEKPLVYDKDQNQYNRYTSAFSYALAASVSKAVSEAGGHTYENSKYNSKGMQAARWFIDHYPLLGGLAAHFNIVEDYAFCNKNDIHIAAIDVTVGELYLNPASNLSIEEWKFVLAHEYLHAGLQHHNRCNGREHQLWNVACDFVINGWLHELQIGVMPAEGLLYDPELAGLSAETIYDMLLSNLRKYEKLDTFRGFGKGDIMSGALKGGKADSMGQSAQGVSLDEFCRNALLQGLEYHQSTGRGYIPAGLIEEIRALSMPPIPWDVELAKWFDVYFAPLEKHRSYARPSRRQACTPDIPRPRYCPQDIPTDSRTFGVIIDTSGSMEPKTIGKALGTIASYSVAHDVPFARVVFCDAAAYDAGYLSPEDIAGRVSVKGRGGTVLQPAVDLLESAKDFPKDGPILIITDGMTESHMDISHKHAFLLPKGKRLPFRPRGEVFYFDR
ncbi:MAG: hypothetical protein NC092_07385 [Butyrivibrio sp.]|nr:hypothetical protein [Muribaculum sp.]MCM1552500.1 hypothetical protein [Butyrivibrio sp.]